MKPRLTPLAIPTGNKRYWTWDCDTHGNHTFKHPFYGIGAAVMSATARYETERTAANEGKEVSEMDAATALLPISCLMIGVCWSHPRQALESVFPAGMEYEAMLAYGRAVCDELQEAGYDLLDILSMGGAVAGAMSERQNVLVMAEERARFSGAPEGSSTGC